MQFQLMSKRQIMEALIYGDKPLIIGIGDLQKVMDSIESMFNGLTVETVNIGLYQDNKTNSMIQAESGILHGDRNAPLNWYLAILE